MRICLDHLLSMHHFRCMKIQYRLHFLGTSSFARLSFPQHRILSHLHFLGIDGFKWSNGILEVFILFQRGEGISRDATMAPSQNLEDLHLMFLSNLHWKRFLGLPQVFRNLLRPIPLCCSSYFYTSYDFFARLLLGH